MRNILIQACVIFLLTVPQASAQSPEEIAASLNKRAVDAIKGKNYESAIKLLDEAVALDPLKALPYYNLGTAYFHSQKTSLAEQALRHAIDLDPKYAEAYNQLGVVMAERSDLPEAIRLLKRAIELQPTNAIHYYNLGCFHLRLSEFRSAIDLLTKAAKLDPGDAEIRLNLAFALQKEKRLKEAVAEAETAVGLSPADDELRAFLAGLYVYSNNRGAAIEQYAKIKTSNPKLAQQLFDLIYRDKIVTAGLSRQAPSIRR